MIAMTSSLPFFQASALVSASLAICAAVALAREVSACQWAISWRLSCSRREMRAEQRAIVMAQVTIAAMIDQAMQ